MSDFIKEYLNLLIKQYNVLGSNAQKEISLFVKQIEDIYKVLQDIINKFDLDIAVGDQLDKIGAWVGITRHLPDGTLADDEKYRWLCRAKIAKNNTVPYLAKTTNRETTLLSVYFFLTNYYGFIVDNKNMSMTVYYDLEHISTEDMLLLRDLDLLPRPSGVQLFLSSFSSNGTFSFSHRVQELIIINPPQNSKSFGQGSFARKGDVLDLEKKIFSFSYEIKVFSTFIPPYAKSFGQGIFSQFK